MPPRKSVDSVKATNGADDSIATPSHASKEPSGLSIEDLSLPRSMIQRLAKGMLPPNTQIQKDALLAMCKSATVFVNYLASQANENALAGNKRTIQPKDVLRALEDLEYAEFLPRCETELQKYNTVQCDKRNAYRRKIRDNKKAAEVSVDGTTLSNDAESSSKPMTNGHGENEDDDQPRASKKPRTSLDPTMDSDPLHVNGVNGDGGGHDTADEDEIDDQIDEEEEEEDADVDEDGDEDEFHSADSEHEGAVEVLDEDRLENDDTRHGLDDEDDEGRSDSD